MSQEHSFSLKQNGFYFYIKVDKNVTYTTFTERSLFIKFRLYVIITRHNQYGEIVLFKFPCDVELRGLVLPNRHLPRTSNTRVKTRRRTLRFYLNVHRRVVLHLFTDHQVSSLPVIIVDGICLYLTIGRNGFFPNTDSV